MRAERAVDDRGCGLEEDCGDERETECRECEQRKQLPELCGKVCDARPAGGEDREEHEYALDCERDDRWVWGKRALDRGAESEHFESGGVKFLGVGARLDAC